MSIRVVRALMPIPVLGGILLSGFPASVHAQTAVTPADRTSLGLTVYSGYAQIRDTRRVPGGPEVHWTGFPSSIDPGTILLTTGEDRVAVEELGLDRGLGGRAGALAGHEGERVILVAEDGREIEAVLVNARGPVFQVGQRLIVDWQGHVEVPVAPGRPTGAPTIRWTSTGTPAGPLTLSYLADAFSWSADYTAVLAESGPITLAGNITIDNRTDFEFPEARIQVVAGDVRRGERPGPPRPMMTAERAAVAGEAFDAGLPEREALGDVHLYTLPEPVTLGAMETARTPLFTEAEVGVEREYVLRGQVYWYQSEHPGFPPRENPEIWLRFPNEGLAGADEPLPEGTLHVYRRGSDGALQFVGDGAVPSTPDGEQVRVVIGRAFDLVAERVQTDFRSIDERTHESAWRITIRNRSSQDATVQVYEPLSGDATIVEESQPHDRIDASTVRWSVPVEAGGESVLTYRVRTTF